MPPRGRMARLRIVSPTSQVKVATSEHQYFSSDSVLLRATWGSGLVMVHPNRIGLCTIVARGKLAPTSQWAATCS